MSGDGAIYISNDEKPGHYRVTRVMFHKNNNVTDELYAGTDYYEAAELAQSEAKRLNIKTYRDPGDGRPYRVG